MAKKKRPHTDTTVALPTQADVKDIMRALLKTPPPPAGDKSTRKAMADLRKRARKHSRAPKKARKGG
jgi:hypothetical protein